MRITVIAFGSRGDVQPYIALPAGLQSSVHSVKLAAFASFAEYAETHGLQFAPLIGDSQAAQDQTMRSCAQALGRQMQAENGVERAVRLIHSYLGVNDAKYGDLQSSNRMLTGVSSRQRDIARGIREEMFGFD